MATPEENSAKTERLGQLAVYRQRYGFDGADRLVGRLRPYYAAGSAVRAKVAVG